MVLGKLDRFMQKNETKPLSCTINKNLKQIKDLNVRPETMLADIGLISIFFGSVSSSKGIKSKNKQMELHRTKK